MQINFDNKHLFFDNYNADFYKYGDDLYKIYKIYIPEKLELQLMYNERIHEEVDSHIILPTELLYGENQWLIGYKMNFVDGIDLGKEIKQQNFSYEDKIFFINEMFNLLREAHNYLIVGDIRNSNIMVGKDNSPYLIDLDFAKRLDDIGTPFCRYHIYDSYEEPLNDKNEDIIKMYVSTLSLLYNYNVEHSFSRYENIDALEMFVPYSGLLRDYYCHIRDSVNRHQDIEYLNIPIGCNVEREANTTKSRILCK